MHRSSFNSTISFSFHHKREKWIWWKSFAHPQRSRESRINVRCFPGRMSSILRCWFSNSATDTRAFMLPSTRELMPVELGVPLFWTLSSDWVPCGGWSRSSTLARRLSGLSPARGLMFVVDFQIASIDFGRIVIGIKNWKLIIYSDSEYRNISPETTKIRISINFLLLNAIGD